MARERLDTRTLSPLPPATKRGGRWAPRAWPAELLADVADRLAQRLVQLRAARPGLFQPGEGRAELAGDVGCELAVALALDPDVVDPIAVAYEVLITSAREGASVLAERLVQAVVEADSAKRTRAAFARSLITVGGPQ